MPIGLDPAHPFPQVANKSLNFIDMGLITGTRTMRRGYDPSTAVYVAIWEERPAHVVAERF